MSKFTKTFRRATFSAMIASLLVSSTASAGTFTDLATRASQRVSSSPRLSGAAQQFKAQAQQFRAPQQVAPSQQMAPSQQFAPSSQGLKSRLQGFKSAVQPSAPQQLPTNVANRGIFNSDLHKQMNSPSSDSRVNGLKSQLSNLKSRVSGKTPVATAPNAIPGKAPNNNPLLRNMQALSFGDIISAPADALGSAAKEAGKVLPGPVGTQFDQAGKVLDVTGKFQKDVADGVVKVFDQPVPKLPPKAPKPEAVVPPPKVIKASGKARTLPPPPKVIKASGKARTLPKIEMLELDIKPVPGPVAVPAPVPQAPPVVNQNRPFTGEILGQVLSNLPRRQAPVFQSAPVFESAPVQYAPAPVQYAPAPVQYATAPVQYAQPAAAPVLETETSLADLVLVDIKLASAATALAGPSYSLRFTNQGMAATPKFVAAAITSNDGSVTANAPKAQVEVPGMDAGETRDMELRLPRGESSYLVLALDLNGAVSETDKDNNVAIIERAE